MKFRNLLDMLEYKFKEKADFLEKSVKGPKGLQVTFSETNPRIIKIYFYNGRERFIFKYSARQEVEIIENIAKLAEDQDCNFNWDDAKEFAYQLSFINKYS